MPKAVTAKMATEKELFLSHKQAQNRQKNEQKIRRG